MQNKYVALAMMGALVLGASQAKAEGKDGVAAVVNGEKITVAEIRQAYDDNPGIKKQVSFKDFYNKALEVVINGKLVIRLPSKPTLLLLRNIKSSWLWPKKTLPARFTLSNR